MESELDFYKRSQSMFLSDFFDAGNSELKIAVERRRDVESGLWFTATWLSYPSEPMEASAQTMKLMWERVMKAFLQDERERDAAGKIAVDVVREIRERQGAKRADPETPAR